MQATVGEIKRYRCTEEKYKRMVFPSGESALLIVHGKIYNVGHYYSWALGHTRGSEDVEEVPMRVGTNQLE